jgi:hypothetical protein
MLGYVLYFSFFIIAFVNAQPIQLDYKLFCLKENYDNENDGSETGVLGPRPKLLRFHMPGPATYL